MNNDSTMPDTIVLVHGFWVTPRSWEHWIERYERGATASSPPRTRASRSRSRRSTPTRHPIEAVTVPEIIDTHRVGDPRARQAAHPHGPLRRRRLHADHARPRLRRRGCRDELGADRGRARGAALPVQATFPVLKNPANHHRAVGYTHEQWQYAFTNTFTEEESRALYERYESPRRADLVGQRAREPQPGHQGKWVDYHNDARAPLLFLSGGEDHLMPPAIQASNAKHYKSNTMTEVKVYPGRSHLMPCRGRLAGGRGLRAGVGRRARGGAGDRRPAAPETGTAPGDKAADAGRPHDAHRRPDGSHRGRSGGGC